MGPLDRDAVDRPALGRLRAPARLVLGLVMVVTACGAPPAEPIVTFPPETIHGNQDWWVPSPGASWDWYLEGGAVPDFDAAVVDVDLFETTAEDVAALHDRGTRVICYLSAGTLEPGRPDADAFPSEVLGEVWDEWGEVYLDIRRIDVLGPIMRARLDLCARKGFDGVEPDNVDTFWAETGFPLTREHQLAFNRWLASAAHDRGLGIGLKNAPDLAADLVTDFDFAVTEDCLEDGWCAEMRPFLDAFKAVYDAEYTDRVDSLDGPCELGISVILVDREIAGAVERGCA
jgi:hypothetical protein